MNTERSYELAVMPESALVIEPGESNIERCRVLHHARKLVDLEFAMRVKAELDGPGSKTQQQVADEIGCSRMTIYTALSSIGATRPIDSRSSDVKEFTNHDLEGIDRHFDRVNSMSFDDPEDLPDDDPFELDDERFETEPERLTPIPPEDIVEADAWEGEPDEPAWSERETRLLDKLKNGETVVVSMRSTGDPQLWRWAQNNGVAVRIDRNTEWGNPFELPADGNRHTVILNYAQHYLPHKPSLLARIERLRGKALGCWCAPEPCHGDVLREKAGQ